MEGGGLRSIVDCKRPTEEEENKTPVFMGARGEHPVVQCFPNPEFSLPLSDLPKPRHLFIYLFTSEWNMKGSRSRADINLTENSQVAKYTSNKSTGRRFIHGIPSPSRIKIQFGNAHTYPVRSFSRPSRRRIAARSGRPPRSQPTGSSSRHIFPGTLCSSFPSRMPSHGDKDRTRAVTEANPQRLGR